MQVRVHSTGLAFKSSVVLFVAGIVLALAPNAIAAFKKPLLIPGKRSLFQKVITHPGANLYATPQTSAEIIKMHLKPFSVFYVYNTAKKNGTEWLEVGHASSGKVSGWLERNKTSNWWQSLTLMFTERTGRSPVLFFKKVEDLIQVAGSPYPGDYAKRLVEEFDKIQSGQKARSDAFPILAMEPFYEAVAQDRFYLIPIFQTVEAFVGVKFQKVASIDPGSGYFPDPSLKSLKTAITFVIDTTISMRPYIQRTREAVRKIYDAIEKAKLTEKVTFGLVGFRSSTVRTPTLDYVSKVFVTLKEGTRREILEKALQQMEEAKASSHSFNEDAFAGLKTSLESLDWSPYQSRLIFLITDAGPILNNDPFSVTGLNSIGMADMAASKGVKIFALHLKTPAGKRNHNYAYAEREYRVLTGHSDATIEDLYVPIDSSTTEKGVKSFGEVVEKVAGQMVELVRATSAGERLVLPDPNVAVTADAIQNASRKAAILGYAMQLEFLGQKNQVKAPEVVTAWVSDMDLIRPDRPSLKVGVLLTKNQLSDLYQRLKLILNEAQRTKRTGAKDFFQSILSASAQLSRDPTQFSQRPDANLGKLGVLAEFLEDLPYRSRIMQLTEDDWYRMSVGEQQALVDDIKSKIRRYNQYYNDVSQWVSFGPGDPGDAVCRIPLSIMP